MKPALEFVLSPGEGAGLPSSRSSQILAMDHPGDANSQAFSALCLDKWLWCLEAGRRSDTERKGSPMGLGKMPAALPAASPPIANLRMENREFGGILCYWKSQLYLLLLLCDLADLVRL